MGRTGSIFSLVPIGTRDPPTNRAVREAIHRALAETWREELPAAWRELASGWISNGQDSLVTIQDDDTLDAPATEVTFWFERGVDWAIALAEHWLDLALAARRPDVQRALKELGVEIPAERWPALGPSTTRFIEHEHRVGRRDGDAIWWEAAEPGSGAEARGQSALSSLPKSLVARLEAGECLCPACVHLRDRIAPEVVASRGVNVEPVFRLARLRGVFAPRAGGVIAWGHAGGHCRWTARRDASGVWRTVHELDDDRELELIHSVDGDVVAVRAHASPKPERVTMSSRDGGATWSEPVPTKLPAVREPALLANPSNRALVFAYHGKALYRSDDGGRTFGRTLAPKLQGMPPHDLREVLPCGGCLVAQWQRTSDHHPEVAVSDDGGKTFEPIQIDATGGVAVWGTTSGAVVAYATWRGREHMQITTDGGRSWTERAAPFSPSAAHFGGRWFAIAPGDGLYASDDEGASWTKLVTGAFENVFADDSDPTSCYVATTSVAFRVTTTEPLR